MDIPEQEENKFACSFCDCVFPAKLQLLSHKLSSCHIKKVKAALLKQNFLANCMVCHVPLLDLKQVETHVEHPHHKNRLKIFLNRCHVENCKSMCYSCGLSFESEVGLEVHHATPPHQLVTAAPNLPKVNEIVKQLGGLPYGLLEITDSYSCTVCKLEFRGLEDYVLHLFSIVHIHYLRKSSCIICNKEFVHTSDREAHLASSKHQFLLKGGMQLQMKVLQDRGTSNKGVYLCMYCMVQCNSWLCFELHVLDKIHSEVVLKRKGDELRSQMGICVGPLPDGGDQGTFECEELCTKKWKSWREEPAGLSGWCHVCGTTMACPDRAEKHLEDHYHCRIPQGGIAHPMLSYPHSQLLNSCDLFECHLCQVSFRSAFSFSVHEALLQHHLRIAMPNSVERYYWCVNCGIKCKDNCGGVDCIGLKATSQKLQGQMASESAANLKQYSKAHLQSLNVGACYSVGLESEPLQVEERGKASIDLYKFSPCEPSETAWNVNSNHCEKEAEIEKSDGQVLGQQNILGEESPANGLFELQSITQVKRKAESSPTGTVLETQNKVDMVLADNNKGSFLNDECLSGQNTQRESGVLTEMARASVSSFLPEMTSAVTKPAQSPPVENQRHSEADLPPLSSGENHGKRPDSLGNLHAAGFGIPVVAGAILSPSESLQDALCSVMRVVSETLLAMIPTLLHPCASITQSRKHERECGRTHDPDCKRACLENSLEAAIQHGLQSVHESSSLHNSVRVKRMDGNIQQVMGQGGRVALHGSMQHNGEFRTQFEIPDGTAEHSNGNLADKSISSSVSLISNGSEHLASVVVAAALCPHSSVATLTSTEDVKNVSVETEKYACNDELEVENTGISVDAHMPDGFVHIQGCSSMEVPKVPPVGMNEANGSIIESEQYRSGPVVLQTDSRCLSCLYDVAKFDKQEAKHGGSSSSTSVEGSESDSESMDSILAPIHGRLLQTASHSSETEDSFDSDSETDS